METIMQDMRPIKQFLFDDGERHAVGFLGVTKIIPYEENGELAPYTWLAVYVRESPKPQHLVSSNEVIKFRVPANKVSIEYFVDEREGEIPW